MILVSIFDRKSNTYSPVTALENIASACRGFENAIKKGQSDLSNFPEDFELVKIGDFDNLTGLIEPNVPHISLAFGSDYAKAKSNVESIAP